MPNKIVLENELFYCIHIADTEEIKQQLRHFTVKKKTGNGLVNYLQNYALVDEENGEMRTYLVKDTDSHEIVGYFSLKAGMVSVNEKRTLFRREFDCVPGIELANFAVNNSYKEAHKEFDGLGKIIFVYFILAIVKKVSMQIGVKTLFIFALPHSSLINYYKSLHFQRLSAVEEKSIHRRIKPRYDQRCIFMCQSIM